MIRPSKEDFLRLAKPEHLLPVVRELAADRLTPVDAWYATGACYLLESAEKGQQVGRYSFLGVEPELVFEVRGERCVVTEDGKVREHTLSDPLRLLADIVKARPWLGEGDLSPFPGGAVGYIGFETVRRFERLDDMPGQSSLGLPDSVFLFARYQVVFDNLMHTVRVICNQRVGDDPAADYEAARAGVDAIAARLEDARRAPMPPTAVTVGQWKSNFSKEKFCAAVAKITELIAAGEAVQVVLSQRLSTEYEGDPFAFYRALRSINPSPYMFFLDCGDFKLFGASPEMMVRVKDGRATLRPIAGTRPRGATPEEDERLRTELLADEKERAEHIMLVDLGRNDLGRVAVPGSVSVDRYMDVEFYSHVMHIVSEVSCRMTADTDVFDVIRAAFPAGTVSGAPKVRAMQIIRDHEPCERGPYAGLVGYLSYTGTFDSCITIRSVTATRDKLYAQVGMGIVYDSVPEREYEETVTKIRAVLNAVAAGRHA